MVSVFYFRKDERMKKRKRKLEPLHMIIGVAGIVLLILLIVGISSLIKKLSANQEQMNLYDYYNITNDSQAALIVNDVVLDSHATLINDQIYLDYNMVHDYINPRYYWDTKENLLLYTTASDIISIDSEATRYFIGKSSKNFGEVIVKSTADSALINIEFLKLHSDFSYTYYESPSRVVIRTDWSEITVGTTKKRTELRLEGELSSSILTELKKNTSLTILEEKSKWSKVSTQDGIVGYVNTKHLKNITKKKLSSDFVEEEFLHIFKDAPINLVWHTVSSSDDNTKIADVLSHTKGVNVVSPSWFSLKNTKGNIQSFASKDYVDYCHNHGVEVWGMLSNENSSVDITELLTHTSSRHNLVNQLVASALQYNFDGININFENLNEEAIGDAYIQFIRELSIKCENNDVSLSVNVPAATGASDFHHYEEQSLYVDYVIVKAFNQHNGQETGAGSIASLSWVMDTVNNILESGVPSNQMILGVPLYTRLWSLLPTNNADESYLVSFTTMGMSTSQNWMSNNIKEPIWLEDCAQWYGESSSNGTVYKMWLEDSKSIEQKLIFLNEKDLAGAAFYDYYWSNTKIWDTIIKYIN